MNCEHGKNPAECLICWSEWNIRLENQRLESGLSRSEFETLIRDCVAKYRRAQTSTGGFMKPENIKQEAYTLAREIVAEHLTIGDIEWFVRSHAANESTEKLLEAAYPGYLAVKEDLSVALGYSKVSGAPDIEDLHLRAVNAYSAAAFALGFAAAMQLKGN
jgi:hypothetical protein